MDATINLLPFALIGAAGALALEILALCSLWVRRRQAARAHIRRPLTWVVTLSTLAIAGVISWLINGTQFSPSLPQIIFCGAGAHALLRAAIAPAFPAPAEPPTNVATP